MQPPKADATIRPLGSLYSIKLDPQSRQVHSVPKDLVTNVSLFEPQYQQCIFSSLLLVIWIQIKALSRLITKTQWGERMEEWVIPHPHWETLYYFLIWKGKGLWCIERCHIWGVFKDNKFNDIRW